MSWEWTCHPFGPPVPVCAADNDLVWVGRAANYAAKLTSMQSATPTWITADVYDRMNDSLKTQNGQAVWQPRPWTQMNNQQVYCSTWYWHIR